MINIFLFVLVIFCNIFIYFLNMDEKGDLRIIGFNIWGILIYVLVLIKIFVDWLLFLRYV